jgi:hypothetical protein
MLIDRNRVIFRHDRATPRPVRKTADGTSNQRSPAISATGSSKGNCGATHQLPSNWRAPERNAANPTARMRGVSPRRPRFPIPIRRAFTMPMRGALANPGEGIVVGCVRPRSGFEEAVRRANAALTAGADMAFVEAPQTVEEVAAVPGLVKGPCLLNVVWRGKTPEVAFGEAEQMAIDWRSCPAGNRRYREAATFADTIQPGARFWPPRTCCSSLSSTATSPVAVTCRADPKPIPRDRP